MPRIRMPQYPNDLDDPWHLTAMKVPQWIMRHAHQRARVEGCEVWVVMADWMQRAGRLPSPPPLPPAVRRRYRDQYSPQGYWDSAYHPEDARQLELGASSSTPSSTPPSPPPKRASRTKKRAA